MIKLTQSDKEIINSVTNKYLNVHHIHLSCGSYYIKFCNEEEAIKEILGKKIFDIVGICCPNYIYLKDKKCVLSEDLNELPNFKYVSEFKFLKSVTLDTIINKLCLEVSNQEQITYELNIMHFIDILFSNTDRHTKNYGLTFDEKRNAKLVVFDNGMFLEYLDFVTKPVSSRIADFNNPKSSECNLFLNSLDEEQRITMIKLYEHFKPETVELILNSIEKEYGIKFESKNKLLKNYIKNYKNLYFIIYKHKHIQLIKR